ncbi:MAG: 30S ribosomal protein S11 [Rickettsiales bacterium]|jgi:small subunit ribosomal protein S11|nr:30S ribosomal protein S11 [Rickettsiales bacterium]
MMMSNVIDTKIYIKCTLNNTIINVTNAEGDSLFSISAGHLQFKKSKRTSAYSAKICLEKALDKVRSFKPKYIQVDLKGLSFARMAILKELRNINDLPIVLFTDSTPRPFNGCRKRKQRRI